MGEISGEKSHTLDYHKFSELGELKIRDIVEKILLFS